MPRRNAVLLIGGCDSSGGAGIARDLRTLAHFDTHGLVALTAVTAQSNTSVSSVHVIPAQEIRAQLAAAQAARIGAIKIGMLGTRAIVETVASSLAAYAAVPTVLDPVLAASSGGVLLDAEGRAALLELLLPRVSLITPNIPEAAALLDESPAMDDIALIAQARRLHRAGARAVLIKGGHARSLQSTDILLENEQHVVRLATPRVAATMRGSGCALASAIAAELARGTSLGEACVAAKRYVRFEIAACRFVQDTPAQ